MPRAATRKADAPVTTGAMQGDTPIHRIVPAKGAPSPFSAAASVFDAGQQAKPASKRGGKRQILPLLDPATLTVRSDLPMPSMTGCTAKGCTRYDHIFDSLTADGMSVTGIPIRYRQAIDKARQSYLQARPALAAVARLVVRKTSETECGVWRAAKVARP